MWPFGPTPKSDAEPDLKAEILPPSLVEQARQNPNGWVYTIDPAIKDPMGDVPFFAIVGWHKVNDQGVINTPFETNKDYDPDKTQAWIETHG